MIPTVAALLFAHATADFILQTNWMAANKRNPAAMLAHAATVLVTAIAATGSLRPELLALAAAHILIDLIKTFSGKRGLAAFLIDQAVHIASLITLAALAPTLWSGGLWAPFAQAPAVMALATGLIAATRAGGFAVGFLMEPWAANMPPGLKNGGRAIGHLERGLIFLLILSGMAEAIGFLIAAKSVLRFGTVSDDRAVSEYVIIGTLASFGWAIATAFATVFLLSLLPPLGIPDLTP